MKEYSQCRQILGHLRLHGSITPLVALQEYGCMRLGARILDLKRLGISIKSELVSHNGKKYACYTLNNCDKNGQYALI